MFLNMNQSYLNQTWHDKMAEENVPAPTRTDEQLVPIKARLPIGKSNLLMNLQKMQKNPVFHISSCIYSFQLDELWFTLDADLIRSALGITPKDFAHLFMAPPAGDLAIKTFFSDAANLKVPTKKPKPHVIPYCQFTKLIICYSGGRHNIHKRSRSPLHITADDYSLDNLKFVPKGELDEKYLDMAARKPRQATTLTDEEGGKTKKGHPIGKSKKLAPAKQHAPAKQPKPVKKKPSKPTPSRKIRKGKRDHPKTPIVKGKGKGIASDELVAQSLLDLQNPKKKSTTDQYIF
ncbi:hypothetical protein Tco_0993179 [Tanacetum coccineum]|uniref:Uncharacterized protein n=1 Tax=Tanacetum coccineum TaxID=301880 RepID=A0ABQ5F5H4_9ASTR